MSGNAGYDQLQLGRRMAELDKDDPVFREFRASRHHLDGDGHQAEHAGANVHRHKFSQSSKEDYE